MGRTKIEYVERPKTAWDGYCEFLGYLVMVAAAAAALVGIAGGLEYMFSDKTPPKQTVIEREYYPTTVGAMTCKDTSCTVTIDPSSSGSGTVTSNAPRN